MLIDRMFSAICEFDTCAGEPYGTVERREASRKTSILIVQKALRNAFAGFIMWAFESIGATGNGKGAVTREGGGRERIRMRAAHDGAIRFMAGERGPLPRSSGHKALRQARDE